MPKKIAKNDSKVIKTGRRRMPNQSRSRMTVESILDAATEIVRDEGYFNASTNRIAAKAGINISSLYQYFSNREAIARALYENTASQAAKAIRDKIMRRLSTRPEEAMPVMVETLLDIYLDNELILIQLVDEVPELRADFQAMSIHNLVHGANRLYMEQQSIDFGEKNVELMLFFIENSIMSNIKNYVQQRPKHISKKQFIQELSKLLVGYMRMPNDEPS